MFEDDDEEPQTYHIQEEEHDELYDQDEQI